MVIKPEISKLVKSAGITPSGIRNQKLIDDESVQEKLNSSGLDIDYLFNQLRETIETEEGAVRLAAIKTGLQAHHVDSEPEKQGTIVNIIIHDPQAPAINPILLPRQMQEI